MDKVKEIKELAELFAIRDYEYSRQTGNLLKKVTHVTDILLKLFDLPLTDVLWGDVELIDNNLVILATITFAPDKISPYIATFAPPTSELPPDVEAIEQIIRIGIPMQMVFAPEEELTKFLRDIAQAPSDEEPTPTPIFDADSLTAKQMEQLLLFQHNNSTNKH